MLLIHNQNLTVSVHYHEMQSHVTRNWESTISYAKTQIFVSESENKIVRLTIKIEMARCHFGVQLADIMPKLQLSAWNCNEFYL